MLLSLLRQSSAPLRFGVDRLTSPLARTVVTNHSGLWRDGGSRARMRWCPNCRDAGDEGRVAAAVLVREYSFTRCWDARSTVREGLARPPPQKHAWMPLNPLAMVSAHSATTTHPAMATFRVPPIMTKHDIREYLTKIYRLPVVNVNTMNYEGKRKRIQSSTGKLHYYKYANFKKAVVTFNPKFLTDVGLGTQTPELGEKQEEDAMASG